METKQPPDIENNNNVFRIIKCPLKSVLKKYDIIQPIIESAVLDINKFVIIGYQFIRLYLLDKFNKNLEFPTIDKQFILDVLKTIGKSDTNRGKQKTETKIKNKDIKNDIKNFYDTIFSKIITDKLSYSNKTYILYQTASEMITCLETNISTHFIKHLFKYINCNFKDPKTIIIKQERDTEKRKEMYKDLNEEIRNLKSDLINNKIKDSKVEYHQWIKDNSKLLYPLKISKSVCYDVKIHPDKYIKYSFYINKKIEELGRRPYQIIPQRNNIVPKNIVLNTSGITDLISSKYDKLFNYSKSKLILNCKFYQKHIWSKILKLEKNSIFKNNKYVFYNQIITDGFSCSLLFILKQYKDKKFGDRLPKVINDDNEFKKIEELTKDECNKYLSDKYKLVSVDPGKIRITTMIDDKNKFFKYSACKRRFDTYVKRSNEIIKLEKIKHNIIKKETELSSHNSKSVDYNHFKLYLVEKDKLNKETTEFYKRDVWRKMKFRQYSYGKKSVDTFLNKIKETFGENILIGYGNWSRSTQMKHFMPTMNKGLRKLIHKKYDTITINECNTSKKCCDCNNNLEYYKDKENNKVFRLLVCSNCVSCENKKIVFRTRDANSSINIMKLTSCWIEKQERPLCFQIPSFTSSSIKTEEEKVRPS